MKILKQLAIVTVITVSSLSAHTLWVNSFESFEHKPGHSLVGIGWGHSLPIGDSLSNKITIKEFNLVNTQLKKTALRNPNNKKENIISINDNLKIVKADVAMQKIVFNENTKEGTYQIELVTKPTYFTKYIDINGKKRLKLKPKDELKNIKKILFSMKHQAFAKSYFSINKWTNPTSLGHTLEIIPKTDLSKVKVGDNIEIEALFNKKLLNANPTKDEYLVATSNSRGLNNSLFSYIVKGKANIRITNSGQWIFTVKHQEKITKGGTLKKLFKKANVVSNIATITFNVK